MVVLFPPMGRERKRRSLVPFCQTLADPQLGQTSWDAPTVTKNSMPPETIFCRRYTRKISLYLHLLVDIGTISTTAFFSEAYILVSKEKWSSPPITLG